MLLPTCRILFPSMVPSSGRRQQPQNRPRCSNVCPSDSRFFGCGNKSKSVRDSLWRFGCRRLLNYFAFHRFLTATAIITNPDTSNTKLPGSGVCVKGSGGTRNAAC